MHCQYKLFFLLQKYMEAPSTIIMDKSFYDLQVHTSLLFAVSMKNKTFCLHKKLKFHDSAVEK